MTYDTLRRVHRSATTAEEREHVTLKIYREPENFNIGGVSCESDLSLLRWTVDTKEDLSLVREIYSHFLRQLQNGESNLSRLETGNSESAEPLNKRATCFGWREILKAYPGHPEWLELNCNVNQNAA